MTSEALLRKKSPYTRELQTTRWGGTGSARQAAHFADLMPNREGTFQGIAAIHKNNIKKVHEPRV